MRIFSKRITPNNWTLAVRLTLTMTLVIVMVVSTVTILSVYREQQSFHAELAQQAELLLDTLEVALADPLYMEDADALGRIMQALAENHDMLLSGRVYDAKGRILADAYEPMLMYALEIDPIGEQLVQREASLFEWKADRLLAGRPVLVERQRLGAIRLGLSTGPLKKKLTLMHNQGIGVALVAILAGGILALRFSQSVSEPLRVLADATRQIAAGNLSSGLEKRVFSEIGQLDACDREQERLLASEANRNEILSLSCSLLSMVRYLRKMAHIADTISRGESSQTISPRSEADSLGQAFARMTEYLRQTAGVAETIAAGNLEVEVVPISEKDLLNCSLQRMVKNLQNAQHEIQESMRAISQQNWIKTGQAQLSTVMRGEQDPGSLASHCLSYLATYLQAQIGAIYLVKGEQTLVCKGTYAAPQSQSPIPFGAGIAGQAALEKRALLISDIPDGELVIASGMGTIRPRHILASPFLFEGEVKGVLELGTIHEFSALHRDFVEQVAEHIAIAFHSAQVREYTRQLLRQTQQQAEELQTQQEELRVTNEELEEQADMLRRSEGVLQKQQEELRQTNEELADQTRLLAQQQHELQEKNRALEQTQRLLEEKARDLELSSHYKSEFFSRMSHELRTPLNSLLILSRLLAENPEGNLTGKQLEFARTIHSSGTELLELLNELLDLSKIEAGQMMIHVETVELEEVKAYLEQHFAPVAQEQKLLFEVQLEEALPPTMETDRQRVEQILKNLLSNAFKFTTQGGVTVRMSRPAPEDTLPRLAVPPHQIIALSVVDTGIGIPEEQQQRIFEAFQQAEDTTSRDYGGTGLGLSITRELAKLLGGEVRLRSQEGEGSTFTLYLPETWNGSSEKNVEPKPLQALPLDAPEVFLQEVRETASQAEPAGDEPEEFATPEQVLLIIEDDSDIARLLGEAARERGFQTVNAETVEKGQRWASRYRADAIFLDCDMPSLDDLAIMERLRNSPDMRHIPVYFVSERGNSLEAMRMGALGVLPKPVVRQEIARAFTSIEQALSSPLKKLLLLSSDEQKAKHISVLFHSVDATLILVESDEDAQTLLLAESFDCLILQRDHLDSAAYEFLRQIRTDERIAPLPIVLYLEGDFLPEEEFLLDQCAESVILEGEKSLERLLDEVLLFLFQLDADADSPPQPPLKRSRRHEDVLDGKVLLLVDDDMRTVFALSSALEEQGMTVLIAENGKVALELLQTNPETNAILMDLMMPQMDGYDAIEAIRKHLRFKTLPIIALTAKTMKGERQRCLDIGANDYLAKPVEIEKLLSLLRVWLY